MIVMTSKQFCTAIDELGLNQREAANFLGVGERTARRWCNEEDPPYAVAALLRVMQRYGISTRTVSKIMERDE